ncbi:MAG: TrmH family RNA methyltransferase, partial [Pseudomonas sp.]
AIARNTAPNPRRMIIAEGLWAHNLLLRNDVFIDTFLWCPEAAYGDEARKRAVEVASRAHLAYQVSGKTLTRISERDKPDGLFSIAQLPMWEPRDVRLGRSSLVMVADGMEIPGNLGTLIRTVDAAGADCLVLTNRRTRLTHPKVFRASQGMVLKTPVLDFERTEDAITWLRSNDVHVYLADTDGAKNYRSFDYSGTRTAFVSARSATESRNRGIQPVTSACSSRCWARPTRSTCRSPPPSSSSKPAPRKTTGKHPC